ncbi:MAG: hypothetical protein HOB37_11165 [Rhodospirillaceae bacterium]|nr:hypothetical protein [Rhodospirillaceae bacterium]MBT5514205.1 hypothetical protein [Rhodospirillaceae bacterium]MBT6609007.1 hypothetical protein [Rhodospirillaceae bacterium]
MAKSNPTTNAHPLLDKSAIKTLSGQWPSTDRAFRSVIAEIFEPKNSSNGADYFCIVRCAGVLDTEKRIFGRNKENAVQNAEIFIQAIWDHNHIDTGK